MENVEMDEIFAVPDAPIQRFLVGDLVEVRQLDKGLRGSWHPARVVEVHEGKRMVEYEELVEDDKSTKLRELVPVGRASDGTLPPKSTPKKSRRVLRLRPLPPAHPDSQPISWQEGVWIEYKFNDAWWEGVLAENITTVNGDDVSLVTRKSEVHVHFPEEDDFRKGKVSDMRIGQEWEEETGIWSLKGSAPVPVPRPKEKKKRGGRRKRSSPEDYSDVDGDEKREIDIVIHSGNKGTPAKVDLKFTCSDTGSWYLDTPFGSVLNFTQKKNAYTLQVTTHDLPKERVSVLVEKGDVVVKARYVVEQQLHNIPARWSGSESSRLTLPNDVEREKITAELENSLLTLTLPKQIQSKSRSSRAKV